MNNYSMTIPGTPVPWARARKRADGGFYTADNHRAHKDAVAAIARAQCGEPFDGPIRLELIFIMPRPKHHYGTGKNAGVIKEQYRDLLPAVKPDIDNLEKLVMDALNGIAYTDDARIVEKKTREIYENPDLDRQPQTMIFVGEAA